MEAKKLVPYSVYLPVEYHSKLKAVAKERKASAMMRPGISVGPPAANGTTMVIGRLGKSCACDAPVASTLATARHRPIVNLICSSHFTLSPYSHAGPHPRSRGWA